MNFAATDYQRSTTAGVAAGLVELERASREAEAAGDLELAEAIESHLNLVQRVPSAGAGAVTLVMRSGRRVPLREARSHIRRGAGRASGRAAPAGSVLALIQSARAGCRSLASEIDREKIATAVASLTGRSGRKPVAVPVCGFCEEPDDQFGDCGCVED